MHTTKHLLLPLFNFCFVITLCAQTPSWHLAGDRITTPWAELVSGTTTPLPEYPRPQMVREGWLNLNGLWEYVIQPKDAAQPNSFGGMILVPFAAESALSGVGKMVGKDNKLWYHRAFAMPPAFKRKNVLLHFGAVDWQCEVFVNGQSVGRHEGGYDPFSFDITSSLKKSGLQEIVVSAWDPSSDGPQPRGKQVVDPHSIWYTPVTGIWQTVWIEGVSPTYIESTWQTPNIDRQTLTVQVKTNGLREEDEIVVSAWDGEQKIAEGKVLGPETTLRIPDPKLWSPDSPFLYDLTVTVFRRKKIVDEVKSYFAMRKISVGPDQNEIQRMLLNNQFLFQYGPLDQGWWPDGLYTAPTDEALKFDIEKTKAMGFNMIRKHVKVEPARWYYYCDKLGMLVWQDMPSGDLGNRWESRPGVTGLETDRDRTAESEKAYRTEWKSIIDANYNFPCIVVWVPFNEGWGQFKTAEIVHWTMTYDASRLVNAASGGNFFSVGHILDLHNYPEPAMPKPELFGKDFVLVLGEFGGLGLPVEGHTWQAKDNWGYQSFPNPDELLKEYESFISRLELLIPKGLSAAVYTQTTDVEIEVNGLMTYDRKVVKMPEEKLHQLNSSLYKK
jgi:Glycosyl hydrolases family 2/Glycosyl hydrolases family 2, sugar binding domain/Glycosyl hydrolases family 2, TIM barrel domain